MTEGDCDTCEKRFVCVTSKIAPIKIVIRNTGAICDQCKHAHHFATSKVNASTLRMYRECSKHHFWTARYALACENFEACDKIPSSILDDELKRKRHSGVPRWCATYVDK